MKRIFFALTAVACFGASATGAQAQYQQPYPQQQQQYGRPAQQPQPQAMRAGGYQAARPAYGSGYGVQQTAMRPSTNTYAATPTSAYALKPVNPPSPATQRILMASRTQPTAAPPQAGPAAPSPSNVRLPASPAQANWGAPPSGGYDSGAMQYGAGQMGAAPVNAQPQPDPGISGNGPIAGGGGGAGCENGQCGGDSCGTSGCCLFGCCGGLGNCSCIRTTGDLVQHTPFFGTTHGYYYFRPYHVMHVFSQQELATRWGADPRNPYDNTIFQRTYESMGVDLATIKAREEAAAKAKAAGLVDPANEVPTYNIPYQGGPNTSVPTPLPGGYQGVVPYGSQGQFVPQGAPQGNYYPPQGQGYPGTGFQGGAIPQGAMPNVPGPSIEYVPNR